MKRVLLLLLALLALIPFTRPSASGESPLRIATESNYPPFASLDESGNLIGFDVDMAQALCRAMERECVLLDVPWDQLITGLEQDHFDAVVASLAKTPERAARMDYTDRYYTSTSAFVARPGTLTSTSVADMRGRSVAVVLDTVQARYVNENYQGAATISSTATLQEAFELLVAGEVDAVFAGRFPALSFLQSPRGAAFDFVDEPVTDAEYISNAYITVQKDDDELRRAFNKAIRTIRADGTYHRINFRYFPFDIY